MPNRSPMSNKSQNRTKSPNLILYKSDIALQSRHLLTKDLKMFDMEITDGDNDIKQCNN